MNLFKSQKKTGLYCGVVVPAVISRSPIYQSLRCSTSSSDVIGSNVTSVTPVAPDVNK